MDKVVGRAAAFLYVLLEVKEIYAGVMSEGAADVLSKYGICSGYGGRIPSLSDGFPACHGRFFSVPDKFPIQQVISYYIDIWRYSSTKTCQKLAVSSFLDSILLMLSEIGKFTEKKSNFCFLSSYLIFSNLERKIL